MFVNSAFSYPLNWTLAEDVNLSHIFLGASYLNLDINTLNFIDFTTAENCDTIFGQSIIITNKHASIIQAWYDEGKLKSLKDIVAVCSGGLNMPLNIGWSGLNRLDKERIVTDLITDYLEKRNKDLQFSKDDQYYLEDGILVRDNAPQLFVNAINKAKELFIASMAENMTEAELTHALLHMDRNASINSKKYLPLYNAIIKLSQSEKGIAANSLLGKVILTQYNDKPRFPLLLWNAKIVIS